LGWRRKNTMEQELKEPAPAQLVLPAANQ